MVLSVLLMSSSPAVFREITLGVWEWIPQSTLWRDKKKWSRGGRNGEGREMGESRRRRGEKWRIKNTDKNKLKCCSTYIIVRHNTTLSQITANSHPKLLYLCLHIIKLFLQLTIPAKAVRVEVCLTR